VKPAHLPGAVKTRCARASYGCIDSRMTSAYANVYTVRATPSRSPFAFRCAASAPPRAASATKARKTSWEPPPSRCARALGGTGWLAGWTPASLLVYPQRRGATPDPAAGGCARSAGPCFRGLVPRGPALRAHPPPSESGFRFCLPGFASLSQPVKPSSCARLRAGFASLSQRFVASACGPGAPERGRLGSAPGVLRPPGPTCVHGTPALRFVVSVLLCRAGCAPNDHRGRGRPLTTAQGLRPPPGRGRPCGAVSRGLFVGPPASLGASPARSGLRAERPGPAVLVVSSPHSGLALWRSRRVRSHSRPAAPISRLVGRPNPPACAE
jgi:hypothetical protein